jgi:WXXGXW repeat (2 copies)
MRKTQVICCLLFAMLILALPSTSSAQIAVGVSIHIGPPVLPVYAQPVCPGPGYLWTPGYWAYGPAGYYWVPGTWVVGPVGMLWTPGYWGFAGGVYAWHAGYWGPHVGFYGGINYGFGYGGVGFVGGEWRGGVFAYNTAVMHVDTTIVHTTYVNRTVINNTVVNHTSFNGPGGVTARPNAAEMAAEHEHHMAPIAAQTQHEHEASTNHALLASENHGHPAIAATSRPGEFSGHGVVAARGNNEFHPPAHNEAMAHTNSSSGHPSGNNNAAHSNNSGFNPPKNNGNSGSNHANNESHNSKTPPPSHNEKERKPQK